MKTTFGRILLVVVGLGAIGLLVGYLIYGKIGGDYVSLSTIFRPDSNAFEGVARSLVGIEAMRHKILMCGGIGALIGLGTRITIGLKR